MDFHKICGGNDPAIERAFHDLCAIAGDPDRASLLAFVEFVAREGRVGINMRPMVLLEFLGNGKLLNIHEWAARASVHGGLSAEEALRQKLGSYYDRRVAFDGAFEEGHRFRYGALKGGGLGAYQYGELCSIFQHAQVLSFCLVGYLKSDSLNAYMGVGAVLDEEKLSAECVSDACKHFLAGVKLADAAKSLPADRWPGALCNSVDYIEVILLGDLEPDHLDAVRIAKGDFDLYREYAYNEFREKLSELDRYRVDAFAQIDERLNAAGVPWEPVNDA